jgi:hypothetical protein
MRLPALPPNRRSGPVLQWPDARPRDQRCEIPASTLVSNKQRDRCPFDPQFSADDQFDPMLLRFTVCSHDSAEIGGIGNTDARVSNLRCMLDQSFRADGTVTKRERRVRS